MVSASGGSLGGPAVVPVMRRRRLLAGAATLVAAPVAGCVSVDASLDHRAPVTETITADVAAVAVQTTVGDVTVRAADHEDVVIEGTKLAARASDLDGVELVTALDGDRLDVMVDRDDLGNRFFGLRTRPDPDIDLELAVPRGVAVTEVDTAIGAVDLEATDGPTTVDTSTGDIAATAIRGGMTARATTGSVALESIAGPVTAETSAGDVTVVEIAGDVAIESTAGDVDARSIDGDLHVDTAVGSIEYDSVTGAVVIR